MDYALYRNLFRKILVTNRVTHSTIPSLNLQDFDFISSENFQVHIPCSFKSSHRFGHYSVFFVGGEPCDVALDLLIRKKAWLKKLHKLQPKKTSENLRELRQFKDQINLKMSLKLRRFVDHMRSDPLPGFEADRNWLYSGGTIGIGSDCAEQGLIALWTCSGPGLSSVSKLTIEKSGTIGDESNLALKISDPVLQITCDPRSSLTCVRQKNNINILKSDGLDLTVVLKKKVRHSNYFTSAAIWCNNVAIAKNLGSVVLFDVQTNKVRYVSPASDGQLRCPRTNAWCQLHWRVDGLWVIRKKMISLVDSRVSNPSWSIKECLEDCEEICNYFESKCDPLSCYLATNHNLFHVDTRQRKLLGKWTHMMKNIPTFGEAIKMGDEELVLLQSANPGEAVVVTSGSEKVQVAPLLVPGITDSLRFAQLQGHCLDPEVSKRVSYTVTGSRLFMCGDTIRQITQNAGGDIFIRSVEESAKNDTMDVDYPKNDNRAVWESWAKFEANAPIMNGKPFYTEIIDMTKAMDLLQIPYKGGPLTSLADADWAHSEQLTVETLPKFKDVLVEPILEPWNIPTHEEDEIDEPDDDVLSVNLKVEEWLSRHIND